MYRRPVYDTLMINLVELLETNPTVIMGMQNREFGLVKLYSCTLDTLAISLPQSSNISAMQSNNNNLAH